LPNAVQSGQDSTQFIGIRELHLVEEERDAGVHLLSNISEFEENFIEIHVELPAVASTALRVDIDRERHTGRHRGHRKRAHDAESRPDTFAQTGATSQTLSRLEGNRRESGSQRTASAKFELTGVAAATAGTGDFATAEIITGQTMVGTSAIDSTAAQTFSVTMLSSATNGTQTFTRQYAITELIK